jgi:predicted RNase H-like HicB family nuclease
MNHTYVALIRKEPGTDYWVDIPDLPGCVSAGDTPEKAKANFQEALVMHLRAMADQGLSLPSPRTLDDVLSTERDPFTDSFAVEIDDSAFR